ncbi:MAG TPA: hypothetical protein VGL20_13860 [Candidatus Dormibacteraeota bacterium]|jgi:hypothetical protein
MAVTRRCPRCARWHAVLQACVPGAVDLTSWVAGTLHQQDEADRAETRVIAEFRRDRRPAG